MYRRDTTPFSTGFYQILGDGRVVQRCPVPQGTGASNWYLAYSWARPAILVAGKGRRGMFLFLLFLHFHSCSSFFPVLSFISSTISSISCLPVSGRRHKMTHKGWCVVKPQHNQFYQILYWNTACALAFSKMKVDFKKQNVRTFEIFYESTGLTEDNFLRPLAKLCVQDARLKKSLYEVCNVCIWLSLFWH